MFDDIPERYRTRGPKYTDATELVSIGRDYYGREAFLHPHAASAWLRLVAASEEDRISLLLISAFRSIERQRQIIQKKLDRGLSWEEILRVSAFPGFSEHHTGCAVDVASSECPDLIMDFEQTPQFRWLTANAARFGFRMSYPRDNQSGVDFEPWHWMWDRLI
jgi:zinc D-Ala-D-Ala carboxypeptidase